MCAECATNHAYLREKKSFIAPRKFLNFPLDKLLPICYNKDVSEGKQKPLTNKKKWVATYARKG